MGQHNIPLPLVKGHRLELCNEDLEELQDGRFSVLSHAFRQEGLSRSLIAAQGLKMKTRLSEDGTKLIATYELHPFDFDRSGRVQAWTFLRMLEFARIAAIRPLIKERTGTQNDGATAFVRYQEVDFAPRFYAVVKPDSSLIMSTYLGYVGRSSLFYKYDIRSGTSNDVIGRSSTQMVRVNRQTRRPIAWPDALIENLSKKGLDRPAVPGPFKERPAPMFVCKVTVHNSDIDVRQHTNQSVYLRYCLDAAAVGARKNVFSVVKDTALCPIRKVGILYQKEALIGDELTVELWEDQGCAETLCFQIKRGKEDITQVTVQFYTEKAKLGHWEGHLKLWILAAIIDSNQLAILSGDKARLRIPGLLETVTGFARYQEFRIEPAFYTKLRAGDRVTVTMSVSHVGRTSWLLEGDLRLASTGEVLCCSLGQGVLVNVATRKPTAVPDNLRKLFPKKDPLSQLEVPTPLDPGQTCRHDFVALPSDSDMNEHTNFTTYIRFCVDAVATLVRKGIFLKKDQFRVKKISLLFQNETKEGENVTVEAAEDSVRPHCLHFQVKRGSDNIVKLHPRNVTPWKLALLIGYARLAAITEKSVFLLPGYLKTITSFLRYQEFLLEPAFYTDVKPRSFVVVTVGVGYVGRTSYELKGDVRLAGSGVVLCRFSVMSVVVDISTRRPVALPETLRRKGRGPRPTSCLPFSSKPPATHSQRFDVRESDLDFNGHTNQSNYIRFCSDAAAFATKLGRYPSLKGDLLKYPLKKIAMLYEKEALLGDPLQVESWEIPSKPVSLGFKVTRGNDDVIRGLFELYGEHAQRAKL
ncbi:uncharacterized protein LOC144865216 [Branchiostoma floridae x Branchiostoma japonicum]